MSTSLTQKGINYQTRYRVKNKKRIESIKSFDELFPAIKEYCNFEIMKKLVLEQVDKPENLVRQQKISFKIHDICDIFSSDIIKYIFYLGSDNNDLKNLLGLSSRINSSLIDYLILYKKYVVILDNIFNKNLQFFVIIDHSNKTIKIHQNRDQMMESSVISNVKFKFTNIPNLVVSQRSDQINEINNIINHKKIRFLTMIWSEDNLLLKLNPFESLIGLTLSTNHSYEDCSLYHALSGIITVFDNMLSINFIVNNTKTLKELHNSITTKCPNLRYINYEITNPSETKSVVENQDELIFPNSDLNFVILKFVNGKERDLLLNFRQCQYICGLKVELVSFNDVLLPNSGVGTGMYDL